MNFLSHSTGRPITGLHTPGPSPCSCCTPVHRGGTEEEEEEEEEEASTWTLHLLLYTAGEIKGYCKKYRGKTLCLYTAYQIYIKFNAGTTSGSSTAATAC